MANQEGSDACFNPSTLEAEAGRPLSMRLTYTQDTEKPCFGKQSLI